MAVTLVLCGCLLLAIFLCRRFLTIITINGSSMEPTFITGDRLLAVRHWPTRWLRKNQIVVIKHQIAVRDQRASHLNLSAHITTDLMIKRLIGLPHDIVVIPPASLDQNIRQRAADELQNRYDENGNLTWHIPQNHGFIKGDSTLSVDSVLQGPIPLSLIDGIIIAKLPRRANDLTELAVADLEEGSVNAWQLDITEDERVDRQALPPGLHSPLEPNGRRRAIEPNPAQSMVKFQPSTEAQPELGQYSNKKFQDSQDFPNAMNARLTLPFGGNGREGEPGTPIGNRGHEPTQIFIIRAVKSIIQMLSLVWQAYPSATIGSILITVLQGLLPLASAWIIKVLFDWLAIRLAGDVAISTGSFIWLLAAQAAVTTAIAILPNINQYLNAELGRRLTVLVETSVYQKINSFLGIAHFENPKIYDTIRLAQQGADSSFGQTLQILTPSIQSLVTLLSFIGVLFTFNPTLASLVLLAALPQLLTQLHLGQQRFSLAFSISTAERRKFYYEFLLADVQAVKEVRLFGLGQHFLDQLIALYKQVHKAERALEHRELRWESGLSLLSSGVATATFIFIVMEAFAGRLTLGDITLYVSAVAAVQEALNGVISGTAALNESVLFHSYFQNLLALPSALPVKAAPQPVPPLASTLELRHVSFRYHEGEPWVLRNVNLTIQAGTCLALVGLNGAGKTTLVKLLTRLYDPTEGEILWNGIDIREFHPDELRQRIGAIFQDFMRYDLSIRENIGLGNLAQINNLDQIQTAAQRAHIHEDVMRLPRGYETEVSRMFAEAGEGFDLSGGQWQKVATARMFTRNADLLILDEPTAALDAQAEYEVYSHFAELTDARTSILISHRFSTVRMADCIAVLEGGQITEYGTHMELLKVNGNYARLYRLQAESYLLPSEA